MAPVHPIVLPALPVLPCDLGTVHLPADGQLWGVPLGAAVDVEVVGIIVDASSQVGVDGGCCCCCRCYTWPVGSPPLQQISHGKLHGGWEWSGQATGSGGLGRKCVAARATAHRYLHIQRLATSDIPGFPQYDTT
jgi:hypothetical protein